MKTKQVKQAQRRRSQIAGVFKAMSRDGFDAPSFLESSPDCLNRVCVYDVVRRLPHMGKDGADNALRRAKVWPTTRMGNLTEDERERIIAHLPPRAKGQV